MMGSHIQILKLDQITAQIKELKNFKIFLETYGFCTKETDDEIWALEEVKHIELIDFYAMVFRERRERHA
jgi:hypothetical protein